MRKSVFSLLVAAAAAMGVAQDKSPYIAKVFEYKPAPGQYVNEMPEYSEGDSELDMLAKANEQLVGEKMPGMVSLGAWGGYVVFGFDHPVVNVPGEYDFKIYGNAFKPGTATGGASEPGIVMVMRDDNANGVPDDTWLELAGSEYNNTATNHNYSITYLRPDPSKAPEPDPQHAYIIDATYIPWTDNAENKGYVMKNSYHTQPYYPQWIDAEKLEFSGAKLPPNAQDTSGTGSNWVLSPFDWGYADNLPNDVDSGFKIDWAVDDNGVPVSLDRIDFVKVYSAENQYCGWIGETSTEISGAEDLHPNATGISAIADDATENARIFNLFGIEMPGALSTLDAGVYFVRTSRGTQKVCVTH